MPHVIDEKCLGEVYAACVDVCPVECIYPGTFRDQAFMVIDPETCIDCGVCIPECPIGAIVGTAEEAGEEWTKINKDLSLGTEADPKGWSGHEKVEPRPVNDPPKKPGNTLVN